DHNEQQAKEQRQLHGPPRGKAPREPDPISAVWGGQKLKPGARPGSKSFKSHLLLVVARRNGSGRNWRLIHQTWWRKSADARYLQQNVAAPVLFPSRQNSSPSGIESSGCSPFRNGAAAGLGIAGTYAA